MSVIYRTFDPQIFVATGLPAVRKPDKWMEIAPRADAEDIKKIDFFKKI